MGMLAATAAAVLWIGWPVIDQDPANALNPHVATQPVSRNGTNSRTILPVEIVDLNLASVQELERLPGIGPVLAQRISEYRTAHPFRSVEDLMEVKGIGERRLAQLKPMVVVGTMRRHESAVTGGKGRS